MEDITILNNKKVQIFLCFGLPWLVYFLFLLVGKEVYYFWGTDEFWRRLQWIPTRIWFWCNFLPALFLFGIGCLINYFIDRQKTISWRYMILILFILVGIDLTIQYLVGTYHKVIKISIIENWLTIIPKSVMDSQERYISTGQMPLHIRLLLVSLGILLGYCVFRVLYFFEQNRSHLFIAGLFYTAGFICFFSHKILFKVEYDYIELYPLVIFDLRDIYLNLGIYTLLQSMLQNRIILKNVGTKNVICYLINEYHSMKRYFSKGKSTLGKPK